MNTIDLVATGVSATKNAPGKAPDNTPGDADFSASLQSAGARDDSPATNKRDPLVTADKTPARSDTKPGEHKRSVFARRQNAHSLTPATRGSGDSPAGMLPLEFNLPLQTATELSKIRVPEQAGGGKHGKQDTVDPHATNTDHPGDSLAGLSALAVALPLQGATEPGASHAPGHVGLNKHVPDTRTDTARKRVLAEAVATGTSISNDPATTDRHMPEVTLAAHDTPSRHTLQRGLQQSPSSLSDTKTIDVHGGTSASMLGKGVPSVDTIGRFATSISDASDRRDDTARAASLADIGSSTSASRHAGMSAMKTVAMPLTATLQAPIGSMAWQQQLNHQLVQMTQRGQQHMELHLHPRELGPLQISLRVDHQSAQAQFLVAHAQVRDAVQQAIPQLREALAGQGITLGEAMVGQQQQQASQQQTSDFGQRSRSSTPSIRPVSETGDVVATHTTSVTPPLRSGAGVDLYA